MTSMRVWFLVAAVSACSQRGNECHSDSDCTSAFPFCDVKGEYEPSGGIKNVCTVVPDDCPPERCGCVPDATKCKGDMLATCNADGKSATTVACPLGCSVDQSHCLEFTPSNGLGDALIQAAGEDDVEIPPGSGIDVSTGVIRDSSNIRVPVNSIVVTQTGAPSIRVFIAHSFKIHSATLATNTDANAIAFVAPGTIEITGMLDASGREGYGAGSVHVGDCVGIGQNQQGGGGGGNATLGGDGDNLHSLPVQPGSPGGATQIAFEPLIGGCAGGGTGFSTNGQGGFGGGGIELVSLASITVSASGGIDVAGGPGSQRCGGGSGGNILLEAPVVSVAGKLTANGGSGGACQAGFGGTPDTTPAPGVGSCTNDALSGNGGTSTVAPGVGFSPHDAGAGGGGAVGRARVRTRDGSFAPDASATMSVVVSAEMLTLD